MATGPHRDRLSKAEIRKDALQDGVTAASHAVGSMATILTTAVSDVARTLGGFATELFEIRDSARRAERDHGLHAVDGGNEVEDIVEVDVVDEVEPAKPSDSSDPSVS